MKEFPCKIVAGGGMENVFIAGSQRFLIKNHEDDLAGHLSFLFGKPVTNQRIVGLGLNSDVDVLTGGYSFPKDLFSMKCT